MLDKPTLVYLAAMILASVGPWGDRKITLYRYLQDKFDWDHDVLKRRDYGLTQDDWDTFCKLLETLTDEQLLELIFEWPAVAHGLDGATGWILQQDPSQDEAQVRESSYSTVSNATGRLKRCGDCANINEDKICSAYGFERPSLTSPQYCPYYRLRPGVDV